MRVRSTTTVLVISIVFLVATAILVSGLSISVKNKTYYVGDVVVLNLTDLNSSDIGKTLVLKNGNRSFSRDVTSGGSYMFLPKYDGNYYVKIGDNSTFEIISRFVVGGAQKPQNEIALKENYTLGEIVGLDFTGYSNASVELISPEGNYSYGGELNSTVAFVPPSIGEYIVKVKRQGEVIANDSFAVVGKNDGLMAGYNVPKQNDIVLYREQSSGVGPEKELTVRFIVWNNGSDSVPPGNIVEHYPLGWQITVMPAGGVDNGTSITLPFPGLGVDSIAHVEYTIQAPSEQGNYIFSAGVNGALSPFEVEVNSSRAFFEAWLDLNHGIPGIDRSVMSGEASIALLSLRSVGTQNASSAVYYWGFDDLVWQVKDIEGEGCLNSPIPFEGKGAVFCKWDSFNGSKNITFSISSNLTYSQGLSLSNLSFPAPFVSELIQGSSYSVFEAYAHLSTPSEQTTAKAERVSLFGRIGAFFKGIFAWIGRLFGSANSPTGQAVKEEQSTTILTTITSTSSSTAITSTTITTTTIPLASSIASSTTTTAVPEVPFTRPISGGHSGGGSSNEPAPTITHPSISGSIFPHVILPGESALYKISVSNPFNKKLERVNITGLGLPAGVFDYACALSGQEDKGYCYLGDVMQNETASFILTTLPSAASGIYMVNATLDYTNPSHKRYTLEEKGSAGVNVGIGRLDSLQYIFMRVRPDGIVEKQAGKARIRGSDGSELLINITSAKQNGKVKTLLRMQGGPVDEIRFAGNISFENRTLLLERVPLNKTPKFLGDFVDSFALDPTGINFTNATMRKVAKGYELWKCKEYNFSTQTCMGSFQIVQALTPGEEYTIDITPEDPLWSERQTPSCTCSNTKHSDDSFLTCTVYCGVNVNTPSNAIDGFIKKVKYAVTVAMTKDGTTFVNSAHNGRFDHDQTNGNGNDVQIGSSTSTNAFSAEWTLDNMASSGSTSFSKTDCSNWASGYCTYYVRLYTYTDFTTPGSSQKDPVLSITLNSINYTWNYTLPGAVVVYLNTPADGDYRNSRTVSFNFTPQGNDPLQNCTLYTNESSWSLKHYIESINNNSPNFISETFSSDKHFKWNVRCRDSNNQWGDATANYTVIVDTVAPVVKLMTPAQSATWTTTNIVEFHYNVSDNNPIRNCSLVIDGEKVTTDSSITKNTRQGFNHTLSNGNYVWNVNCSDMPGNQDDATSSRNLEVDVPPVLWSGKWFETTSSNDASPPANISLANNTDGVGNSVRATVIKKTTITLLSAVSSPLENNGAFVPSGTTVNFRSFFNSMSGASVFSKWQLYKQSGTTSTLICEDATGMEIPGNNQYTYGSCTPSSAAHLLPTDRIKLVVFLDNQNNGQSRTINHSMDNANSYVDILNWRNLGFLSVALAHPPSDQSLYTGDNFTLICNVSCTTAYCLSVQAYAQYKTGAGAWTNIGSSGNIVLHTGTSNPQSVGNITSSYSEKSFNLDANTASSNLVRCRTTATYMNANSTTTREVNITDSYPPEVNLSSPADLSWTNGHTSKVFTFNAYDSSGLASCRLYLNGTLNQTKTTGLVNGGSNTITVPHIADGHWYWFVNCTDNTAQVGGSETRSFYMDTVSPGVVPNTPGAGTTQESYTVEFNFTASDSMDSQLVCSLRLDGSNVNSSILATSGVSRAFNRTGLTIGTHYWNISCVDNAVNTGRSSTRWFSVTDNPPTVSLYIPHDNNWTNNPSPTLYFNASDNDGFQNCTLYLNETKNETLTPAQIINHGTNHFHVYNLADAHYNWTVNCTDTGGFSDMPPERTFTVDTGWPWVELVAPVPSAQLSSSPVSLQFRGYDSMDTPLSCDVNVDGSMVAPGVSASNGSLTTAQVSFKDGLHYWNVTCYDDASNQNASSTREFNLSRVPTVTQNYPGSGVFTRENVTFLFTIGDNDGFSNCSIYIDNTKNESKPGSQLTNNAQNSILVNKIPEGSQNWNVLCFDNGTYLNSRQTGNIGFTVDETPPNITLYHPLNGNEVNSSAVNFNFTVDDNLATTLLCNLTLSNGEGWTGRSVSAGVPYNDTIYNFTNSKYYWNVSCRDGALQWNTSQTQSFNVTVPPSVILNFPIDDPHWDGSGINAVFNYTPSSNGVLTNCYLIIDGIVNRTEPAPQEDVMNKFTTNLTEGKHNWTVRCQDSEGLLGEASAKRYYVDTHAPRIILSFPGNDTIVDSNYVNYTFTAYDNMAENLTCNLTVDNGEGSYVEVANITAFNATRANVTVKYHDGNYTWNITCEDSAGHSNVSSTYNFTIEAPPAVSLITPNDWNWSSTNNISFTYYAYDPYLVDNCTLILDGSPNESDHDIHNGNNSLNVTGLADGYHNWTVRCMDVDGNDAEPAPRNLYVDTLAPWIEINTPENGANYSTTTVEFNFTPRDDTSDWLLCDVNVDGSVISAGINVSVNQSYGFNASIEGESAHYWNVTCIDRADWENTSSTKSFNVYIPPEITLVSPNDGNWSNNPSQIFFFNVSDDTGVQNCSVYLNGVKNESKQGAQLTNNAVNNISVNGLDGKYNWSIRCYDSTPLFVMNQSEERTLYVDVHAPWMNLIFPGDDSTVTSNFVNLTFVGYDSMSSNMSCNLIVNNGSGPYIQEAGITLFNNSVGNLTQKYHDGEYLWNLTCTDYAGNTNTSATYNFTVEAPPVVTLQYPLPGNWSSHSDMNFTFYAYDPFSLLNCTLVLDEELNETIFIPTNGVSNKIPLSFIPDGMHNWSVMCYDEDLNPTQSSTRTFYIDTEAPWVDLNTPEQGGNYTTASVELNFTPRDLISDWGICSVRLDGYTLDSGINVSMDDSGSAIASGLLEGTHYWNATCEDRVGWVNTSITRSFNVYVPPEIHLLAPRDGKWENTSTVIFFFNVLDATGIENCTLLLNNTAYSTKLNSEIINNATNNLTATGLNGTYTWGVRCYDNSSQHTMNVTSVWDIYVDLDNPIPHIETAQGTWFATATPTINFNIYDSLAPTANYTFYVDGSINKNGSAATRVSRSAVLNALPDGNHTVVLEAQDLANNSQNSSSIKIWVDTHAPWVVLNWPADDNESDSTHVGFNFTGYDATSENLTCTLNINGASGNFTTTTNASDSVIWNKVSSGWHYWNVSCSDAAGNSNTSDTWNFTAPAPDLYINSSQISFNETPLQENHLIRLTANVHNIGGANATNAIVQFFQENPEGSGVQIGENQSVNVTPGSNVSSFVVWQPSIGVHHIFVLLDPPLETNGSIIEISEANNEANTTVQVSGWHTIVGNLTGDLEVADSSYNLTYKWSGVSSNASNIFAADSDSSVNWSALQAVGRTSGGGASSIDFEQIDSKLGTSPLVDSINSTYTRGGLPGHVLDFDVFGKTVSSVPVVNSTNASLFVTGILWDYGDGGAEYDGTQDIVFVTKTNLNTSGAYGLCDFEMRLPAQLRGYILPENEVALYLELE